MAYIAELHLDSPLNNGAMILKVNPMRFLDWQEQKSNGKREDNVIDYFNKRADAFDDDGNKVDLSKKPIKLSDFEKDPYLFNDFDETYSHNAAAQELENIDGDGVFNSIIFMLNHRVTLEVTENEHVSLITIEGFEFKGVSFGGLMKVKNAKNSAEEFKALMSEFAVPLIDTPMPITDLIINQISFEDYSRIMVSVGKKLLAPSKRLKKL